MLFSKESDLMDNIKRYRVPHCKDCERCKNMKMIFDDYYCCEENEPLQVFGLLGVDNPPIISPEWCPKREEKY